VLHPPPAKISSQGIPLGTRWLTTGTSSFLSTRLLFQVGKNTAYCNPEKSVKRATDLLNNYPTFPIREFARFSASSRAAKSAAYRRLASSALSLLLLLFLDSARFLLLLFLQ